MVSCILCHTQNTQDYFRNEKHHFLVCNECTTVFRNPDTWVNANTEKERYLLHHNEVEDQGYQKFVSPLVEAVLAKYSNAATGLDFGCGTGPVAAALLKQNGFTISLYDPFFHPDESVLKETYDFIICCEVIEHFHDPLKEFKLLKSLLKPHGTLFCMTNLWNGKPEDFKGWWYKNDCTHTLFYNQVNLQIIQQRCGFQNSTVNSTIIEIS